MIVCRCCLCLLYGIVLFSEGEWWCGSVYLRVDCSLRECVVAMCVRAAVVANVRT